MAWSNIAAIISGLIVAVLVVYIMVTARGRQPISREALLERRIHELEANVRSLQHMVVSNQTRIEELEQDLATERLKRQEVEGQLVFFQTAMQGMNPASVEQAERNRRK